MTELTNYAQFNTLTITGRISDITQRDGKKGPFIAVTLLSNLETDDPGVSIEFLDSENLMNLYAKGILMTGRQVTLCGHVTSIRETYTNKDGEIQMLKRPQMTLNGVTIPTGGLGPIPKDKAGSQRRAGAVVRPSDAKAYGENNPVIDGAPAF